jgi:hypothetical protein
MLRLSLAFPMAGSELLTNTRMVRSSDETFAASGCAHANPMVI